MLVGMPIARGTSNGRNFLCGLISRAMMPDASNVFVGFMPVNSTYFNDALIQDMINEYGQDHRQGMQGICALDARYCALYARYCSLYAM
jgi:hypothetical protein